MHLQRGVNHAFFCLAIEVHHVITNKVCHQLPLASHCLVIETFYMCNASYNSNLNACLRCMCKFVKLNVQTLPTIFYYTRHVMQETVTNVHLDPTGNHIVVEGFNNNIMLVTTKEVATKNAKSLALKLLDVFFYKGGASFRCLYRKHSTST